MKKLYVTYYFPGLFSSETSTKPVDSHDVSQIKFPDNAYAAKFSEQTETIVNGEVLKGEMRDVGKTYFNGGTVKTREQIHNEQPGSILDSNMRCNNYKAVIMLKNSAFPVDNVEYEIL